MFKKITKLALFAFIAVLLLSLAAPVLAESGSVQRGISLVIHASENMRLWLGHTSPADQNGWVTPNDFTFAYVGLYYSDKSAAQEYYIDDTIRVNAVKASDTDPYPSYTSQSFAVKGWIDTVIVYYTMDGGFEIKVTYLREDVTTTAAAVPTTSAAAAPDSGVRFSGLNGQVEILEPGAKDWRLIKLNDVIPVGAHIRTDEDSICVLSFADMSTFVLKDETEIVIGSPPGKDSKIGLVRGNIWANVKKMIKDGSMDIEMNQTAAGIKGTTLILEDTGDTSTVKVIEGIVWVTEKKYGALAALEAGQTITAGTNGYSGPDQVFDVDAATAEWEAVRTTAESATATFTAATASAAASGDGSDGGFSLPIVPIAVGAAVVVVLAVVIASRAGKKIK